MPELVEAQIIAAGLHAALADREITRITMGTHAASIIGIGDPAALSGHTVDRVHSHGKRIILETRDGPGMLVSLGMTGGFLIDHDPGDPHVHLEIHHRAGRIAYRDPRRFGTLDTFADTTGLRQHVAGRLGPPADTTMTTDALTRTLAPSRSTRPLKAALLDQGRLAGIGNYLADEICFAARISPSRAVGELDAEDWERLNLARDEVIGRSRRHGGLTFSDFRTVTGEHGHLAAHLRVYGRSGLPCPICSRALSATTVAGRSTTYCSSCQP